MTTSNTEATNKDEELREALAKYLDEHSIFFDDQYNLSDTYELISGMEPIIRSYGLEQRITELKAINEDTGEQTLLKVRRRLRELYKEAKETL